MKSLLQGPKPIRNLKINICNYFASKSNLYLIGAILKFRVYTDNFLTVVYLEPWTRGGARPNFQATIFFPRAFLFFFFLFLFFFNVKMNALSGEGKAA